MICIELLKLITSLSRILASVIAKYFFCHFKEYPDSLVELELASSRFIDILFQFVSVPKEIRRIRQVRLFKLVSEKKSTKIQTV